MKIASLSALFLLLFTIASVASEPNSGPAPVSVAGFRLGDDISRYQALCDVEQGRAIPDAPFLLEACLYPQALNGIRGGSLIYGSCANPGKVMGVKIKFAEMSKRLFKNLLGRYTKRFGDPTAYKGDPQRSVVAWEWDISGSEGRHVKVLLMYSTDPATRPGVSIQMTDHSLLELEFTCYRKSVLGSCQAAKDNGVLGDLEQFVPR